MTNVLNRFDVLNITSGFDIQLHQMSRLTVAAALPLERDEIETQGQEVVFPDWELIVQFNRYF